MWWEGLVPGTFIHAHKEFLQLHHSFCLVLGQFCLTALGWPGTHVIDQADLEAVTVLQPLPVSVGLYRHAWRQPSFVYFFFFCHCLVLYNLEDHVLNYI